MELSSLSWTFALDVLNFVLGLAVGVMCLVTIRMFYKREFIVSMEYSREPLDTRAMLAAWKYVLLGALTYSIGVVYYELEYADVVSIDLAPRIIKTIFLVLLITGFYKLRKVLLEGEKFRPIGY